MRTVRARTCWLLLLLLGLPLPLVAQSFRHIDQPQTLTAPASLKAWQARAESLRTHLLVSNGLWPMLPKDPLQPKLGPELQRDGYTVRSVAIETLPGFYLVGNLYRPRDGAGPFPAVLSAHGHWKAGRFENSEVASVPGRAMNLARQGYVVLSYSMIGYNENEGFPHRFAERRYELWGFTPMGLQLWNSTRALDFLSTLPEVDPERIGMTGASGGGTQTFLLTAVDPRIRVTAPVNMISAHFQGGCICENAPLLRLDAHNIEIGGLAAPRPLLMVSTSGDWTRNTPQVEYPAMRQIYGLFEAEDHVANAHYDYPHNYNRDSREAVYAWFARWLQGKSGPVREQPFQVDDVAALQAELPAKPRPIEAVAASYVEIARAQIEEARPETWFDLFAYRRSFGTALAHVLQAPGVGPASDVEVFAPAQAAGTGEAVLIVHADEAAARQAAQSLARTHREQGRIAFTFAPRGRTTPDSLNHWSAYNPTVAAQQIAAIRATAGALLDRPDVKRLDLVGLGAAGPATLLARSFLPAVRETTIDFDRFADTDEAFLERLYVPLLRRAGDFRTAAALIAPAPLRLKNMPAGALRTWFQDVYRAASADENLRFE